MRRALTVVALGAGVLGGVLFVAAPAAPAQTGYPPGLCTVVIGSQNVGTVEIGQRFVVQVAPTCLFTPGAAVTVTVNGIDIPGKVAEASGVVLVDVTVVSATELSIDDPVITPAVCGGNSITARGPSATAQGGVSTQTATFTVNCPAGPGTAGVATPVGGRLSLTGANSLRVAVAAAALVAAGAMLVVVTRRRLAS